ncbi:MAG: hypothetical protein PHQ91_03220 [Thermoanaerobaculaceae bacterium]|nr:hypothetical protein [Thermoanaerobaculaceae bacterium]TAM47289.1 MAG: hypothetical protein EPN53_12055 [Acidobacteriota bacterium]
MRIERVRSRSRTAGQALLLGAALAWGCAALFATKIGDIQKAPGQWDGRTVTVAGKVTGTHNLLVVKYYQVDDGTGEIAVVTQSALPKEGENVRVKGRVEQAFALGSAHVVVIVETPPQR